MSPQTQARVTGAMATTQAPRPLDALFLSVSGGLGGAERALLDLLAGLRDTAPERRLAVLIAAPGPLAQAVRDAGAEVVALEMPVRLRAMGDASLDRAAQARVRLAGGLLASLPLLTSYLWGLRRAIRELRPAVLHTNGFKMHVLGALACPARTALVWHLHDYTTPRPLMARALRLLARRCRAAIANSASVAADARVALGDALPIFPVHNAVDLARFAAARPADLDALAGFAPADAGTVRIGLIATLAWWKGHHVFLQALAQLPRTAGWRAYVVGGAVYDTTGSQRSVAELRDEAAALGIGDRVGFTGFVADSATAMAALDIVVHASVQPEPFGLVIAEAMAASRAVVVSVAGGAAELVRHDETALGFTPGGVDELAACMARLIADDGLRARLAANGRAEAMRRFDPSRMAREVDAVYRAVGAA